MVKHFGWTWIGAVRSDSDYGNNGMATFLDAAQREGICVEYSESLYRTDPSTKIQRVADLIRRSTSMVVVAFLDAADMKVLLEELVQEPSPPRQWIGSEGWITDPHLMSFSFCAGAIGVAIQKSVIPGLRDFLLDLSPTEVAASTLLTDFWEEAFHCSLNKNAVSHKTMCDGSEDIKTLKNPYTETSQFRITNMVYKAVYAIAHAIHNAVCQETNLTTQCDKHFRLESKQILSELKKVNFSQNGYPVSFDANGDPVAFYELVNWQKSESGVIELVTVGYYDASLPKGQEFHINTNITWVKGGPQVPVSVCSESCPPGTRKVLQKGKPICCYDCIPCPEGEISNTTDSPDCIPCPSEFWSNANKNVCMLKLVEFLSFDEVLAIILATFSVIGACLAIITAVIFFHHRTTPIVRANNSELSFLLLFSLTLCFLCSLTFIGAPSEWSCMLRHTAFGIIFVLCISCVLGKTVVVLMAFKATLPGSNAMKWFGPPQQRMTVVSLTFIQVLICTVWLVLSPPFPIKNLTTYKEKIILECALGSAVGFWAVLGYIGLLAVFCFVLAVLARKLPDNFNEAKMITFSMLIFCAVWITFIPAYVSSPGKFTVAVEIFAILASSFGLILCIFAPKCLIILFQPEKNSKKYLMNKMAVLGGSLGGLRQRIEPKQALTGPGVNIEPSLLKCTQQSAPRLSAFSMDGDFVIGSVFSLHYELHTVIYNYTTKPKPSMCTGSLIARELRFSRTVTFAIEEINNSTELLPGIKLGYEIYDTCASVPVAVQVAFQLLNGQEPVFYKGSNCSQSGVVMAVVGDSGSTLSISISRIIGSFNIPLVSHFATCACLSEKQQFPTFFRTIPSDQFQADTLAKMVKHFGWTWIGAVHSDSDYGNYGMASFLGAAQKEGICVDYSESFSQTDPRSKIQRIADIIRRSTAVVVVLFIDSADMRILLEELALDPPPPRQWIGRTIGVAIQQSVIPGLRDFLLDLSPTEVAASSVLTEFWEEAFNCTQTEMAVLGGSLGGLRQRIEPKQALTGPGVNIEPSLLKCTQQSAPRLSAFSMDGDFVIGSVFSLHYELHTVIYNYTTKPKPSMCTGSLIARELRFSRTVTFAIEEINNSTELLPGIKLGYEIYDTCASVPVAVQVAFQLLNGQEPVFYKGSNCSQSGVVMAVVGDSGSTLSISISRIIGSFNIPLVSHFATCACLSEKQQFPTFFRTIPSDQFQADTLAKMVKHFGWTWIGAVHSDSDYGNYGMASFLGAAQKEGICVDYSESFSQTDPRSKIQRIADIIRRSTAVVVVLFIDSADMRILLEELALDPPPPRQWIGSEGWITDPNFLRFGFCAGTIGVAIQQSVIPGLRDFLLDLSPTEVAASSVLTEFWEEAFNCTQTESADQYKKVCDGTEDLKTLKNPYTETSQLRMTNMVYKAVYAIAHAIHNAVCHETNFTTQCDKNTRLDSKQVLSELKNVNFSQNGYHVSFDANGDPVAFYELVNWQKGESGVIELVTVGYYDASLPKGQEFHINRKITWVDDHTQVPVSFCSKSCPLGTHKVLQKGKPICCYDCIPCPEGEISNTTDSPDCFSCPSEFWPNAERDTCSSKLVEYLSFDEVLSIILATFSVIGACLAILTAAFFFHHRATPIVRANNSELSFLLLFSLALCFLCSLTFIGAPSEWSCMLRHTAFGITFVLCISCVLGKTVVVLMAFKATLPGSNVMKWFGPPQQRMTVVYLTFIQVLICTLWLVLSPPFPMKNLTTYKEKIILECALGSAVGFWAVLGYIGLLAVFCFVLAVLARKLPDNFNEAKLITFSMLIFCAVWITFIPAYVSSPGKFTVAVEIFAILASSFGLILCIFAPKCFIILFQPEKNSKKYLMNKI
ncbi:uncharacterized protein LOC108240855 [Kryptolebias marmoratus]|uniref:uncharacterized protein LOC108240855 n=1 Tax=Kryptolebias marmoratus TaxID=37003 RepID=UPI0018ACBB23|nr:uncharacterized protein LOC108240855 [Kryptolebias marmoratus]